MMHRLTDMTLDRYVKQGAFGKFLHIRKWIPIDGTWKFPKAKALELYPSKPNKSAEPTLFSSS